VDHAPIVGRAESTRDLRRDPRRLRSATVPHDEVFLFRPNVLHHDAVRAFLVAQLRPCRSPRCWDARGGCGRPRLKRLHELVVLRILDPSAPFQGQSWLPEPRRERGMAFMPPRYREGRDSVAAVETFCCRYVIPGYSAPSHPTRPPFPHNDPELCAKARRNLRTTAQGAFKKIRITDATVLGGDHDPPRDKSAAGRW